jgi:hypothetical protein
MSIAVQVSFDDGGYAKISVSDQTSAEQIISMVFKKRKFDFGIESAVLCVFPKGSQGIIAPLDPQTKVLEFYEQSRSSGNILQFALRNKERISRDMLDENKRRMRLISLSKSMLLDEDDSPEIQMKDALMKEYKKVWEGKAEMFGYMHKTGEINTAFKLRFFVLNGVNLCYYKTHNELRPLNKIDLRYCTVKEHNPKKFEFDVISYKRVFHFRAPSREDMIKWIVKIHQQSQIAYLENRELDELQEYMEQIEATKYDKKESLREKLQDINYLLNDQYACQKFLEYLKPLQADESVLFLCRVKKYKSSLGNQIQEAREIFASFIDESSEHCICIESKQRKTIKQAIQSADPKRELFDTVYKICFNTIEVSFWPSFKTSKEFERMISKYVSLFLMK